MFIVLLTLLDLIFRVLPYAHTSSEIRIRNALNTEVVKPLLTDYVRLRAQPYTRSQSNGMMRPVNLNFDVTLLHLLENGNIDAQDVVTPRIASVIVLVQQGRYVDVFREIRPNTILTQRMSALVFESLRKPRV